METPASRWLVIVAQLMALLSLAFGLQFVLNTTGGTLFLFSAAGPMLVLVSSAIVVGLALVRLRRRHSLFDVRTFEAGESIIRQGEPGDCVYFLQSGEVEVVRDLEGVESVVARLSAGQYFGEMALLSNQPRNATVRALTRSKVALLGKQNFLTMLRVLPVTHEDILKTIQDRALVETRS